MAQFSLPLPFLWNTSRERGLIARAARGDRAAFDDLARKHLPALCAFVSNRSSAPFVDDVVQETLLAAWLAIPRYQPRANFKTWLFRIALNKLVDAARQSATRVRHEQAVPYPTTEGDTSLAHAENRMLAQTLLAELDDEERALLELYYRDGLTFVEIADLQERKLSTVKHRFYRLHVRLADRVGNEDSASNRKQRPE